LLRAYVTTANGKSEENMRFWVLLVLFTFMFGVSSLEGGPVKEKPLCFASDKEFAETVSPKAILNSEDDYFVFEVEMTKAGMIKLQRVNFVRTPCKKQKGKFSYTITESHLLFVPIPQNSPK
jgi:hypothetical protein